MDPLESAIENLGKLVIEKANDLITVLSNEGVIEYVNESAHSRILGYEAKELLGVQYSQFVEEIQESVVPFDTGFQGNPLAMLVKVRHKSGGFVWIEAVGEGFLVGPDNTAKVLLISRDVSQKKIVEELLEEENLHLKRLSELRKNFVSNATHELKTPISTIASAVEFLLSEYKPRLDDDVLELVEIIDRGASRLKKLVSNLLDFSRIETGALKIEPRPSFFKQTVMEAIESIKYAADYREIPMQVDEFEDFEIYHDKFRVEQVIINLLSNAIKNSPNKSAVTITVDVSAKEITVSVKDAGIGISADEFKVLFTKFGKIERDRGRANYDIQGSGLGLFISRQIINAHGGRIWAESEGRHKGSTFLFMLPRDKSCMVPQDVVGGEI